MAWSFGESHFEATASFLRQALPKPFACAAQLSWLCSGGWCDASQLSRVGVGAWIGQDAAWGQGAEVRGSREEPARARRVVKVAQWAGALDTPASSLSLDFILQCPVEKDSLGFEFLHSLGKGKLSAGLPSWAGS